MQNFGQIKFQVDKEYIEYTFSDQKFFNFFYIPRLTTRRDAFFRIILTDLQSKQQVGDIPISTHFLAETFQSSPSTVIEEKKQFIQGVSLRYKIYQPIFEMNLQERPIGFGSHKIDTKTSGFFSRTESQQMVNSKVQKNNSINQQQPENKNAAQKISLFVPDELFESNNQNLQNKGVPQKAKKIPKVPILASLLKQPSIQNSIKESKGINPQFSSENLKVSIDLHSSQFINRMLGMVRQTVYIEQKKKHSLTAKSAQHHVEHKLSKKIKFVIFLLIFGFLMTIFDVYQDKQQEQILKKSKKRKAVKRSKIIHA